MTELDPRDPIDHLLLAAMRTHSTPVADGVLAHVVDHDGNPLEVRAVLATEPRIPGAVGRWLDTLPTDRQVVVPAVVSSRLAGMLDRRGFTKRTWWDVHLAMPDKGAWLRNPNTAGTTMTTPPHPPDETADELRAALTRNHPELSPAEIDALLAGPTNKQHFRWRRSTTQGWTAGKRAKGNSQAVHPRGRRKR